MKKKYHLLFTRRRLIALKIERTTLARVSQGYIAVCDELKLMYRTRFIIPQSGMRKSTEPLSVLILKKKRYTLVFYF